MQGIQRQVAVLDAVAGASERGASTTEVCTTTGLPLATVHRLLEGMADYGILVQEESKRWRLGPRVAFWAGKYLEGPATLEPLRGFTKRLSYETQFFSYLTVLDRDELVCVSVERPESKAHFFVQLGSRIPVLSTAAAKALLAHQPEESVRPMVEKALRENPATRLETVTLESYLQELAEVRNLGYAKCMEELEIGVSAIGAPVTNSHGNSVASLSVVAPTGALLEYWDEAVGNLFQAARDASMMLGSQSGTEVGSR